MKKLVFIFLILLLKVVPSFGQFALDTVQLSGNLAYNYTTSISFDFQKSQWITTQRGLYKIDGYGAKYFVFNPNDSLSICANAVNEVFQDRDHELWVLTGKGVQKFDPNRETFHLVFKSFLAETEEMYKKGFGCALQLDEERILFGTKQGFLIYNKATGDYEFEAMDASPEIDGYSSSTHVVDIVKSHSEENQFYLLTRGGIYLYDAKEKRLQLLPNPDQVPFKNITIPALKMISYQSELIFLCKREVYRYDLKSNRARRVNFPAFGKKPGLLRDLVMQGDSILWISTIQKGLFKLNLNNQENAAEMITDGLFNKMTIDPQGYLWTVSDTKYLVRSKDPLYKAVAQNPFLEWSNVWINDVLLPKSKFYQPATLRLRNFERKLTAEIALHNPNPKQDVTFFYKLKPSDNDWQEIPASRKIQIDHLSAGKYNLIGKIKEPGSAEVYSNLQITIDKYFYETWWFRGLISLTVFFFLSTIYYLLTARRKEREAHQKGILRMELDALRSQMNPHFLFNTLNSIKNYVLTKTPDEAAAYLTNFSKLIRSILENSKHPFLTLEQELNALELYVEMEYLRFGKDFNYQFIIDPAIHPSNFKLAPMLIQPFIENAIWHGLMNKKSDRELLVKFKVVEDGILCEVIDNGIGRAAAAALYAQRNKNSLGLKITMERIKNINLIYGLASKVEIVDNVPSGTKVKLLLPEINP